MTSNIVNGICAFLAVFALGYVLLNLAPLFGYAVVIILTMYTYAWIRRKIRRY